MYEKKKKVTATEKKYLMCGEIQIFSHTRAECSKMAFSTWL